MIIEEHLGAVESFELPDNWVRDEPVQVGGRTTHIFHPADSREVIFCDHYRALPLSRPTAEAFQTVLYAEFHLLSEVELASLSEALEGVTNTRAFRVERAATGYLNDRRIIRVEGNWLEQGQKMVSCFADVGGRGQHIQNVYFSAPTMLFESLEELGSRILTSVRWKLS